MKKALLTLTITLAIFAASAQPNRKSSDGLSIKSNTVLNNSILTDGAIENVAFYPNPVVDLLKVSFWSSTVTKVEIALFNNIGKQVFSQQATAEIGTNILSIDLHSKAISPGIYFIKCKSETDSFTRKLIVK